VIRNVLVDVILPTGAMGNKLRIYGQKRWAPAGKTECGVNENDITFASQTGVFDKSLAMIKTPSDAIIIFRYPTTLSACSLPDRRKPRAGQGTWTTWTRPVDGLVTEWYERSKGKNLVARSYDEMCHIVVVQVRVRLLVDPHTVSRIAAAEKLKPQDHRTGDPSRHYGKPRHP
jgi:threonine synthase